MLQDLAHWLCRAGCKISQDQDIGQHPKSVYFALWHKVHPSPYMLTKQDTNPCNNNGQGYSHPSSGQKRINLLCYGIILHHGTIFLRLLSAIHLHQPWPQM